MNFLNIPPYSPFQLQDTGYWKSVSQIWREDNNFLNTSNRKVSVYGRECNALPGLICRLLEEKWAVTFTSTGEDILHDFNEIIDGVNDLQFSKTVTLHGADVEHMRVVNEQVLRIEMHKGDIFYINYPTLQSVDACLTAFSQWVDSPGESRSLPPLATVKIGPSLVTSVITGDPWIRGIDIETIDSMYVWPLFEKPDGTAEDIGNFKKLGSQQLLNSPEEEKVNSLMDINQSFFEAGYYSSSYSHLFLDIVGGLSKPMVVNTQAYVRGNGEIYLRTLKPEDIVA